MIRSRWLFRFDVVWAYILAASLFGTWGMCAWAASERVLPASGYGAEDYTLRHQPYSEGIYYSAGLEVVYADLAGFSDGRLTRCFLHLEVHHSDSTLRVTLHDYGGAFQLTLCTVDLAGSLVFPQTVKLHPDQNEVWFSYTTPYNVEDWFYTIPWDPTLAIYPVSADRRFQLDGNWEVEWSTDAGSWDEGMGPGQGGRPFFSGTGGLGGSHGVWVRDELDEWQRIATVGGYSCGFAFDNQGNLWAGRVVYSGGARNLFMWTADAVDAAADSGGEIILGTEGQPGDPDWGPTVDLDMPLVAADAYFLPSDIETDPAGNLYVSCNSPLTLLSVAHRILVVENDGVAPWPGQVDIRTLADAVVGGSDKGFRALAYDGKTALDVDGIDQPFLDMPWGNRVFVDMDFGLASNAPDMVVGLSREDDRDADGVPDALDNCREAMNGDQSDANLDGVGDVCQGDCDDSGGVDERDLVCLSSLFGAAECLPEMPCPSDVDGDGDTDGLDLGQLIRNFAE